MKKIAKIFSIVLILFTLVVIVVSGYNEKFSVKYYERFETKEGNTTFINELKKTETIGQWHIKVYYKEDNQKDSTSPVKFEVVNKNGKIFDTVTL